MSISRITGVVCLLLGVVSALDAAPPRLLPFQGRLTDANGASVADGAKVVQFKIFDAPTGGNAVWPGEVQKLTVNGGLVSTFLGSKADLSGVDFNQALYLEITVDANADGQITQADPPLLPRQSILPAVFAVEAQSARDSGKLQGVDWSAVFDNGNPASGKLKPAIISNGSIPATAVATNKGIVASQLAQSAVGAPELADSAVDELAIQDNAVTSIKLKDGEVNTVDLANLAVQTGKLADGAVQGTKIAPSGVAPDRLLRDIAIFADIQPADTDGGTSVAGWQKRTLTKDELRLLEAQSAISRSGNVITLQPGTYYVRAHVPTQSVGRFQAVVRDVTENPATPAVVLRGTNSNAYYTTGSSAMSTSWIEGVITVTGAPRQFEVWQYNQLAIGGYALGQAIDAGPVPHPEANIYTRIVIERLK